MAEENQTEHPEQLISVETQTEHSLTTGKKETQIFVKMYTSAVSSGLIADMGDANWRTLCVIASYMNEQGDCFPTQAQIAKGLGVSRESANRRVRKLAEYRWKGRPVIETIRKRGEGGRWENTRYTVLPISQLRIFEAEPEHIVRE